MTLAKKFAETAINKYWHKIQRSLCDVVRRGGVLLFVCCWSMVLMTSPLEAVTAAAALANSCYWLVAGTEPVVCGRRRVGGGGDWRVAP